MSVASCGCDATFAGMAACHCLKCHASFADRPAYDAHRRLARPCLHPSRAGHGAARRPWLGLGSTRRRVDLRWGGCLSRFSATPPDPCAIGARSAIDGMRQSADLRAIGALGAAKRPPQFV